MTDKRFERTREFPSQNRNDKEWPPAQGQARSKEHPLEKDEFQAWWQYVIKSTDESLTSNNTLQNDDELVVGVGRQSTYELDLQLLVTAGNNTPDFKWTLTYPTGCLSLIMTSISARSDSSSAQTVASIVALGVTTEENITAATHLIRIHGVIRTGDKDGNVWLQWAQRTSNVNFTKVLAGSTMTARRVWGIWELNPP